MRRTRWFAVAGAAVILWNGSGCARRDATPPQPPRPRSTATVAIRDPVPGAVIAGPKVRLEVELTGGRIVLQTSTNLAPDEGHLHLKLDGKLVSMTPGLVEILDATPGAHVVEVEFVANDHLAFDPRVLAAVPFSVK